MSKSQFDKEYDIIMEGILDKLGKKASDYLNKKYNPNLVDKDEHAKELGSRHEKILEIERKFAPLEKKLEESEEKEIKETISNLYEKITEIIESYEIGDGNSRYSGYSMVGTLPPRLYGFKPILTDIEQAIVTYKHRKWREMGRYVDESERDMRNSIRQEMERNIWFAIQYVANFATDDMRANRVIHKEFNEEEVALLEKARRDAREKFKIEARDIENGIKKEYEIKKSRLADKKERAYREELGEDYY